MKLASRGLSNGDGIAEDGSFTYINSQAKAQSAFKYWGTFN
jgi:hypothetical protein